MTSPQAQLITALTVIFDDDGELDLEATRDVYVQLATHPFDGALPAGTTGEFTALSVAERLAVCQAAATAFGPTRTWWHVGAATTRDALDLTRRAVDLGAIHLAALTPHYTAATERAVLEHFTKIVAASGGADVYAYLFATRTTTAVGPSLMRKIADVGVSGVKISGEPLTEVTAHIEALRGTDVVVLSGADDEFSQVVAAGGAGVVSGISSALPKPFLEVRDALRAGDSVALAAAQVRAQKAVEITRHGDLAHLKAILELKGSPQSPLRVALDPISPHERDALAGAVCDLV